MTRAWGAMSLAVALVTVAACGAPSSDQTLVRAAASSTAAPTTTTVSTTSTTVPVAVAAASATTVATTTTTTVATTTTTTTVPTTTTTTTRPRPTSRTIVEQQYTPMSTFADVVIHHPSSRIEIIGWHESGHDGARQMEPTDTTVRHVTMDSRDRGTGSRTAADIAVDPTSIVLSPVSGTVARAGTYTLYCDHSDEFVVINPDAAPSWELKIFHIVGRQVASGDRVEAGVTPIAQHARQLPFESQVDEYTAEPSWPHVHVELVDPSIPDRPSGGGC